MFNKNPKPVKFARIHRREEEMEVVPHLAYDLADVDALISQGKPVSSTAVEGMYYDGVENCSSELAPDDVRGVDMNDLWNLSEGRKDRLRNLGVKSVELNPSK